jgi:hypothetical protein
MKFTRKIRLTTALVALMSVFFTQFALAAYSCPGSFTSRDNISTMVTTNSMPGCTDPDMKQTALCHAHCQDDKQSINKAEVPAIAPLLALGFVLVLMTVPIAQQPLTTYLSPHLKHPTAPPLSILNCCFRI